MNSGVSTIAVSNTGIEHFGDIDRVFAVNVKGQYFVAQQLRANIMADYGRVMFDFVYTGGLR